MMIGLVTLACSLPLCEAAPSHPFHVSFAEISWNPTSGNFEIALCVWPADLEKALARQQGKPVDLDQVEGIEDLMSQYVAGRLVISKIDATKSSSPNTIRWVGQQVGLKKAWLYFEVPGETRPGQWRIENRIFFELNEGQINQVQLVTGGEQQSLSLSPGKFAFDFSTENLGRAAEADRN